MDSLISIIVPAYNAEKYLERCVQALLKQSYQNIEIVIVNDGSTDSTGMFCGRLAQMSDKIKFYTKENGGAASARNYGLRKAQGEYITFVDADDIVFEDYIEYMYRLLTDCDADVSMCSCYKMNPEETMPQDFQDGKIYSFNQEDAIKNLFYRKGITGYPYLKLWRREIVQSGIFPEDMLYGEDFVFVYEMLKRCSKVVYGEHISYIYYQNPGSVDHNVNFPQMIHSWNVYTDQIADDVRKNYPALEKALIVKNYIAAINTHNRIHRIRNAEQFKKELKVYIKIHGIEVFRDQESKLSNRVLGLLGGLSPRFLFCLVRVFFCAKKIFHIELRKAV